MAELFDEEALYREICLVWGECGAHAEVFRDMRKAAENVPALYEALQKAHDMLMSASHFVSPKNGLAQILEAQEIARAALALAEGKKE